MFQITIDQHSNLTLTEDGIVRIAPQPIGRFLVNGRAVLPTTAAVTEAGDGLDARVTYPTLGDAVFSLRYRGGYAVLTLDTAPEAADAFVFGPYYVAMERFGDLLGEATDGERSVCMQSLMPKVMGGYPTEWLDTHPYAGCCTLPFYDRARFDDSAAAPVKTKAGEDGVVLQCYARHMRYPETHADTHYYATGRQNVVSAEVTGPDARIDGAAVCFLCASNAGLLDAIGEMELAEGLPHPVIDGVWAKKSPYAYRSYLMVQQDGIAYLMGSLGEAEQPRDKYTFDELLELAALSGGGFCYFGNPFVSWGHFQISPHYFPDGDAGLKKAVDYAAARGIKIGFHTLSNFIHTYDPYVSPVPSPELLIMDETTLARDVGETDTEILVSARCHYFEKSALNCIRMGDELARFQKAMETPDGILLTGVTRGAFGTHSVSHSAGEKICRLQDHGYQTLYPTVKLQAEMATRVGTILRETGVCRMSFDGMEGCLATGRDEYGCSEYVRRVFEAASGGTMQPAILSDASIPSHYRWHAHTYFNWGEPHYDWERRGGMFRYRIRNQAYYDRNRIPHMLGQYTIRCARGKFEATRPEDFVFAMARMVANDAGLGMEASAKDLRTYGLTRELITQMRLWEELRFHGEVTDEIRSALQERASYWSLDEVDGGWKLSRWFMQDFRYGYLGEYDDEGRLTEYCMLDYPGEPKPLVMRLRIGYTAEHGRLQSFRFSAPWGGFDPLDFPHVDVAPGHYLLYTGGTVLKHFDENFNLIEEIKGQGAPILVSGQHTNVQFHCGLAEGSELSIEAQTFLPDGSFYIARKADGGTRGDEGDGGDGRL